MTTMRVNLQLRRGASGLSAFLAVLLAAFTFNSVGCIGSGRLSDDDSVSDDDDSADPNQDNPFHDWDGDSYTENASDCDDGNPSVHPGAEEVCDRLDTDCDGSVPVDEIDADGDGFATCEDDCDDNEPSAYPGAIDFPESGVVDGIDNDCDGVVDDGHYDSDSDGVIDALDCAPFDPSVYPGAPEQCNGEDDNCDGAVTDEEVDADGDGFTPCEGDSDDTNGDIYPGAPELCDGLDNNLDGMVPAQELNTDADGFRVCEGDCNDLDASTFPGAPEVCDGLDNSCDGVIPANEGDSDNDGVRLCAGDCNDSDASTFPGAPELCNGVDDSCDGVIPANEWDPDGDGVPACAGDCAPADTNIYPGAAENCDGIDNDCNGVNDDGSLDTDGDGFANCVDGDIDGDGFANSLDCAPNNAARYPGAPEVPGDGIDQDCNGYDAITCFVDSDRDGFGSTTTIVAPFGVCASAGTSSVSGDCSDAYAGSYPGAPEVCDGLDNDCDGLIDEDAGVCPVTDNDNDGWPNQVDCQPNNPAVYPGAMEVPDDGIDQDCNGYDAVTCFTDNDLDGFGSLVTLISPDGDCADAEEASVNSDCNDLAASTFPGAPEVCDGIDNNCDGLTPGEVDADGDGAQTCAGDCNDANPAIRPGAPELCNNLDDDCDGSIDEGFDNDGDGVSTCAGDCNDANPAIRPGAPELCDGLDNDCNPLTVEGYDNDGDGFATCAGDCNDSNASIFPGAPELCDGLDNNCDNVVPANERDTDGDGVRVCAGDCNDANPAIRPGAPELCDGLDNDCANGVPLNERDTDGDGFRICAGDCNDTNAAINPNAIEVCDGIDNDCDPLTTEGVDNDGDGVAACAGDCNDSDASTFPGAPELCDLIDNDCDNVVPLGESPVGPLGYVACMEDQADGFDGLTPDDIDEDNNGCDVRNYVLVDGECVSKYTMSIHPLWGIPVSMPGVAEAGLSYTQWTTWADDMGAILPWRTLWMTGCGAPYPYPYGWSNVAANCPTSENPTLGAPLKTSSYASTCTSNAGIVQPLGGIYWEFVTLADGTWGMMGGSVNTYLPTCSTLGYSQGGWGGSPIHSNSNALAATRFVMEPF